MAAAKFSVKTQGLITPVYGALTSVREGEISEQGSKKEERKPLVSQKRKSAPRPPVRRSTVPTPWTAGTGVPRW